MFVERMLDAEVALAICIRAEHDAKLRRAQESAPTADSELRRYRKAGAAAVARYRFPSRDVDAFFGCDFMQDYSEAVFIEGDVPLSFVDLTVFIAPVAEPASTLFTRELRARASGRAAAIDHLARVLDDPGALAQLVGGPFGESLARMARSRADLLDAARRSALSKMREGAPATRKPTTHWTLAEAYEGIQHAQLVIVNVRGDDDRPAGEALIAEIARLRSDPAIFADVVGPHGDKRPITAVLADLSDPADAGLKKAIARVKRAARRNRSRVPWED